MCEFSFFFLIPVPALPSPGRSRVGAGPVLPRHPRRLNAQNYAQHSVLSVAKRPPREERKLHNQHGARNSSPRCPFLLWRQHFGRTKFHQRVAPAVWGYPACHRTKTWKSVAGSNQPNHHNNTDSNDDNNNTSTSVN